MTSVQSLIDFCSCRDFSVNAAFSGACFQDDGGAVLEEIPMEGVQTLVIFFASSHEAARLWGFCDLLISAIQTLAIANSFKIIGGLATYHYTFETIVIPEYLRPATRTSIASVEPVKDQVCAIATDIREKRFRRRPRESNALNRLCDLYTKAPILD